VPFGANAKKRKSVTAVSADGTSHVDAEHTAIHNLDIAEELSMDHELLKRQRLIDNSGLSS